MKTLRRPFLVVLLLLTPTLGCGRQQPFSDADLGRAREALETALDHWKQGGRPEQLRARTPPIEFAEEGPRTGLRLLEYQVLDSHHTDAEAMRFRVKLTVQDRRGRREEREATYAVALKSPIAVGRDPYF